MGSEDFLDENRAIRHLEGDRIMMLVIFATSWGCERINFREWLGVSKTERRNEHFYGVSVYTQEARA